MKSLIRFWREKLEENHWLMSRTDRAMIQETIKALRELQRVREETQVQREADIVRTVKQLSERPTEVKGKKRG